METRNNPSSPLAFSRQASDSKGILLGVNVDHAATLRQARYCECPHESEEMIEPDPLAIALASESAGADGITVHPREDGRHIQVKDVRRMREHIKTRLNMEMACTQNMIDLALEIKPEFVCIVPENRKEVSTEGGLDVCGLESNVADAVKQLSEAGILVSLFIDPDPLQIKKSAEINAPYIELHTGEFANQYYTDKKEETLESLRESAELAHSLGLIVNAGHGINYINIKDVLTVPHLHELNIGHSIISRALMTGIEESVRKMKSLIGN